MELTYSHGREFLAQIGPYLQAGDAEALLRFIQSYWPGECLRDLLFCGHEACRPAVLLVLTLIGTMEDASPVAQMLHEDDAEVVSLAEQALWSIWFRAGDDEANHRLGHAIRLIGEDRIDDAEQALDQLARLRPHLAEVHNQLGIVYFLQEDYRRSLAACREALRLNKYHFGAAAGIGHAHASLGELSSAMEAYLNTLRIHPRMDGIREALRSIRETLHRRPLSDGARSAAG